MTEKSLDLKELKKQEQTEIFNNYLERKGIDKSTEAAGKVLKVIESGLINRFRENKINFTDGTSKVVTTLALDPDSLRKLSGSNWIKDGATPYEFFEDLVSLGFVEVVNITGGLHSSDPYTLKVFTGGVN